MPCLQQIVDLQDDPEIAAMDIQLVSLAIDSLDRISDDADDLAITSPFLSDPGGVVTKAYGVDRWAMSSGEPGHTFVLVDEQGIVRWVKDYGAPENGGLMYVEAAELRAELVALERVSAASP